MNKNLIVANLFFILHILIASIILFGWALPQIRILYLTILISWFICWIIFGYCPITKWEFSLRMKYDKGIEPNSEFIKHYLKKFFNLEVTSKSIFIWGVLFFMMSIILNIIFNL